jgi:two-component system, LuxR family, response regulator FixJ
MASLKRQIHIVDDDVSVCRALKVLLTTFGFKVKTFTSAEAYFSAVPRHAPDCLILDLHMPGLDGWEAMKLIFKSGAQYSVIVITADKNGGLKERALQAGAMGFMQKPFHVQELLNLIQLAFAPKPA